MCCSWIGRPRSRRGGPRAPTARSSSRWTGCAVAARAGDRGRRLRVSDDGQRGSAAAVSDRRDRAGTTLLGEFSYGFEEPYGFTAFAGSVWFAAGDDEHGVELWRTDGTAAGTRLARDIAPGEWSSQPLDLVATDDFLFFSAYHPQYGAEPWRIRRAPVVDPPVTDPPAVDPPVTIEPIAPPAGPPPPTPPASTPPPPRSLTTAAKVTVRVQRLRTLRGKARYRVSGRLDGASCAGRVRIVLGRRERALQRVAAPMKRCRFDVVVRTTSKGSGRWLQVRTAGSLSVASRRVPVR